MAVHALQVLPVLIPAAVLGVAIFRRVRQPKPPTLSICANLVVHDVGATIAWWTCKLGFTIGFTVDDKKDFAMGKVLPGSVFGTVKLGDAEIMMQTAQSLSSDLPSVITPDHKPGLSGTIYLRGVDPDVVRPRLADTDVIKEPKLEWYGMYEMYIRDPNGYVLCLAVPKGAPPA